MDINILNITKQLEFPIDLTNIRFFKNKKPLIKKVLLTLLSIIFIQLTNFIPFYYIDQHLIFAELNNRQMLNFLRYFSQDSFFILGPFTLGLLPYIHSSIIIQTLQGYLPPLKRFQKDEGEQGQQKIIRTVRYITCILSILYGLILSFYIQPFIFGWTFLKAMQLITSLTAGTLITLWVSDIISEKGIGNGTSVIIFINLSSSLPNIWQNIVSLEALFTQMFFMFILLMGVLAIIFIRYVRIQIQLNSATSKDYFNIRRFKGQYIPLKTNPSVIFPLIFASTFLNGIFVILNQFDSILGQYPIFNILFLPLYFLLVLYFSYILTKRAININDITKSLERIAYTIPSVPPGSATIQFFEQTLDRLAILGGLLLAFAVCFPTLLIYLSPASSNLLVLESTSLFILVGIAIELANEILTDKNIESYNGRDKI